MSFQLTPRNTLIGLGLLLVAVIVITFRSSGADPSSDGPYLQEVVADATEPSAENVAPSFHARVMALEDELESTPQDTSLLIELAHLRQDAHQLEEAVSLYERVLEIAPNEKQVLLDLAVSYGGLDRWDDALQTTEELLERFPGDPSGLYNLGAIYANQLDFDQAKSTWELVAAQTVNAEMAGLAMQSLSQLASSATPGPSPGPVDPSTPLPAGHPEIPTE